MMKALLTPRDVDAILRYPNGRAARLARAGLIPSIRLPDGEIRFNPEVVEQLVSADGNREPKAVSDAE